jgi:hypothetical protein
MTRAEQVVALLWDSLKRDPEHKDRRQTGWGTKTQIGLVACLDRIYFDDPETLPKLARKGGAK